MIIYKWFVHVNVWSIQNENIYNINERSTNNIKNSNITKLYFSFQQLVNRNNPKGVKYSQTKYSWFFVHSLLNDLNTLSKTTLISDLDHWHIPQHTMIVHNSYIKIIDVDIVSPSGYILKWKTKAWISHTKTQEWTLTTLK